MLKLNASTAVTTLEAKKQCKETLVVPWCLTCVQCVIIIIIDLVLDLRGHRGEGRDVLQLLLHSSCCTLVVTGLREGQGEAGRQGENRTKGQVDVRMLCRGDGESTQAAAVIEAVSTGRVGGWVSGWDAELVVAVVVGMADSEAVAVMQGVLCGRTGV